MQQSEFRDLAKTTPRPNWPSLVGLFANPLFARYAMCRARTYLPTYQRLDLIEVELRTLIQKERSTALWDEASDAIRQHLRACVKRAILDHLPSDLQDQALDDLERDDFELFLR